MTEVILPQVRCSSLLESDHFQRHLLLYQFLASDCHPCRKPLSEGEGKTGVGVSWSQYQSGCGEVLGSALWRKKSSLRSAMWGTKLKTSPLSLVSCPHLMLHLENEIEDNMELSSCVMSLFHLPCWEQGPLFRYESLLYSTSLALPEHP